MIQGIKFNDKHSYKDYGLVLTKKFIGTPTPKSQEVDVPGRNGKLNLVKNLWEIKYENRALKFEFETIKRQHEFEALFSKLLNDLHGKEVAVILDINQDFYYFGEIYINEWESNKSIGKVVIEVDAEPYKYKTRITNHTFIIGENGKLEVNLRNLRMSTTPFFTFSNGTKITFGNMIISFESEDEGLYHPDILLLEGDNIMEFEAEEGTVITVSYQEGSL